MSRAHTPTRTETNVLINSARRCAVCFGISHDLREKLGQVAHLDQDPSNGAKDNLAFLCFDHHSLYDSKTSQHKNYTLAEVKHHRAALYEAIRNKDHVATSASVSSSSSQPEDARFYDERRALPDTDLIKSIWQRPHWRILIQPVEFLPGQLGNNLAAMGMDEQQDQRRLFATLRFVEQGLAEELRPLMAMIGLHESYVDADCLETMAKQIDPVWTRAQIDALLTALGAAGIVNYFRDTIYEMHPLLTSYLRSQEDPPKACQQAESRTAFNVRLWKVARRRKDISRIPVRLAGIAGRPLPVPCRSTDAGFPRDIRQ